jgi:uncharacterized protein YndB with AHSA1/START domain
MDADTIEREVLVEAPLDRVWETLTEPEHLGRWFGDDGADVDLREGGLIELRWEEHGTVRARIVRLEPKTGFAFRWAPFKDPGGVDPVDGNSTLVEFALDGDEERTLVKVVESGFEALECAPELRVEHREGNTRGWEFELGQLAEYLTAARAG